MDYRIVTISKGVLLASVLVLGSIALTWPIGGQEDTLGYVQVVDSYTWDFSSGLSLSNGFADTSRDILMFSIRSSIVDGVSGQGNFTVSKTCNPDCGEGETFVYSAVSTPYFVEGVSSIDASLMTESLEWRMDIRVLNQQIEGDVKWRLSMIDYGNLTDSLAREISAIDNLKPTSWVEYGRDQEDSIDVGDLLIELWQWYADGTEFLITLVGDQLFIRVGHFTEYYANEEFTAIRGGSDGDYAYYTATVNGFFPTYVAALNEFIVTYLLVR